ncbi:hypothetical protein [Humibacter sp. RRB41]|nr:hypothetical protein [Humibacter sp. RRB41]
MPFATEVVRHAFAASPGAYGVSGRLDSLRRELISASMVRAPALYVS